MLKAREEEGKVNLRISLWGRLCIQNSFFLYNPVTWNGTEILHRNEQTRIEELPQIETADNGGVPTDKEILLGKTYEKS